MLHDRDLDVIEIPLTVRRMIVIRVISVTHINMTLNKCKNKTIVDLNYR